MVYFEKQGKSDAWVQYSTTISIDEELTGRREVLQGTGKHMESYIGLYYPFMEFSNDNWVKLAALYWERIGRIVPKHYIPLHDSDTVRLLTEELGFIMNLYPTEADKKLASQMFLEVLTKYEHELIQRYGIKSGSSIVEDDVYQREYEKHMQGYVQELLTGEETSYILLRIGYSKFGNTLANVCQVPEILNAKTRANKGESGAG